MVLTKIRFTLEVTANDIPKESFLDDLCLFCTLNKAIPKVTANESLLKATKRVKQCHCQVGPNRHSSLLKQSLAAVVVTNLGRRNWSPLPRQQRANNDTVPVASDPRT